MKPQPILTIEHLSLSSLRGPIFKDLSLEIFAGEMLAVMGPSGIGKSMLSKAVAGFLPPDMPLHGNIHLNGRSVGDISMLQRTAIECPAIIFQDALQALNPLASIGQQLCLALTGNKTRLNSCDHNVMNTLLIQLGFSDPSAALIKRPSQLSGGQRQRICIAIALLGNANLIIADEPTSALDPITESTILELLHFNVKQRNICGMLITHDLKSALVCDKVLVIADHQVVVYGEPSKAITASGHPFCQQLAQLML